MDIFFPHTFLERTAFKESAVKCGFTEQTAETTSNVGILPADERISILLMAWQTVGNYLTKNPYNHDVGIIVSWVGRCTLNLWFGREWIACAIENKTELIEQMMKVYPTAFITMHPYSWPYMFSIYRDPWMVEYLNLNFQRMSGSDSTPVLEPKDSEFIQQEGIPLLVLRMVNMFDFRMVKLVKYMCLRLLLTWQDANSTASRTLRDSPNADEYINYARHIYLLAICESDGSKDLHYTLETIQRVVHCDVTVTWSLELGALAIAKGLQESNMTLTELLITFLFKVPKLQFGNIFGAALTKYIHFITEYQLRNINRLSTVKLSWPIQEVYSKLVQMFITHRESSEELITATSKISELIFLGLNNLTASKCAYELIKQRPHAEWHSSKITLLLTIISEEINIIQDYKYNDVQSTDELIEKEKEVAIYYRDLAKLFHKSPYLEQEAWLTTFSLHPCREFMDAVTRCGARNLRAIKKQAHKLKVIEAPELKTKINEDTTNILKEEVRENITQEVMVSNVSDTTVDSIIASSCTEFLETSTALASITTPIQSKAENKPKAKRPPRKKPDKNGPKKIEPKIKDELNNITSNMLPADNQPKEEQMSSPFKRGRPVGTLGKDTKPRLRPTNPTKKPPTRKPGEKQDLAEEIFAAAAGAAENINSQTADTIKYPAFALMNSVTDTEELMKFTNYDEAYEQYTELNKILSRINLNHTCYEDLLTLLIAPRYKRLTWAVSWKKLKKRCRVILTKDNKKRELVEQSMADANDRLTHLNIDYEKYKDKPQIDYGTIEGGYECFDTDSDDDDLKSINLDVRKTKERPAAKKRVKKLIGSPIEGIQVKGGKQNHSIGVKPYLKIENLDSSNSDLLNIIESTHLSKPVYLNKPVYFVRNPLASPSSEAAISLETGPENQAPSRTSSRRSTGEETLTSDSFEEHHCWHLTASETSPEMKPDSQEQKINISPFWSSSLVCRSFLKAETTFNIPASIRQQLEQPTMFFKSEPKNDSNAVFDTCNQEDPHNSQSKETGLSEALNFSPSKVSKIYHHTSTPNQIIPVLTGNTRFSPTLFEDMPEDLTMPKSSSNELYETNTSLSNLPLNLTSRLITESDFKIVPFHEKPPTKVDQSVAKSLRKGKKPNKSLTKLNSRKRQAKKDGHNFRKDGLQDLKTQSSNIQLSINQESCITQPTTSLKSVRIFPHNKNSKAIRINPTAAVVFSSAAASYHRTPFLNVAQQEPNILQQLLSKEIKPFTGIDDFFDKPTAVGADVVLESEDERSSASELAAQLGAIAVPNPMNAMANSKVEAQNLNIQSLSSKTNISKDLAAAKIIKQISTSNSVFDDSELKNSSGNNTEEYQELQNNLNSDGLQKISNDLKASEKIQKVPHSPTVNVLVDDETRQFSKVSENLAAEESLAAIIGNFSKKPSEDDELAANNVMKLGSMINASNLLDQTKNIKFCSSGIEFEFKVPAQVAKPCFLMRSKQKKVNYVSDWVNNITFNDKTGMIIVPVSRTEKIARSYDHIRNTEVKSMFNGAEDGIQNKLSCSNQSTLPLSQNQSDDILYNKHIVFNKKLLDPHLKTYKNTKAPSKVMDTNKLKETFLEKDKLFSGKSEESNLFNSMDTAHTSQQIKEDENSAVDPPISNVISEHSTSDSFLEQPTSRERQSPSFFASTSQNIVHTQNSTAKAKKKRSRSIIPSTKKFDQMFEWIEMVTTSNRDPVPKSVDTSDTLLNLFSAQLMNQAKSIHFNYEYLREKEMLNERTNDKGVNCEASILIASPGPSEDCVKLIKAFKKSTVFKGVDMSSNEVSFTSSLAKEVLGTIVKVTLNESKTHVSCNGNHFDASDAFDAFRHSRRDANSPTFYSPTLSMKHLRNGTLADSVECIDTSLEKLIPKPGRKRSSMPAHSPVTKRIRKKSIDNIILGECKLHSLDKGNQLPLKEVVFSEHPPESTVTNIFKPLHVQENILADCSKMEHNSDSVLIALAEATKPQAQFPLEQQSFDQLSVEINSKSEYKDTRTFLNEEVMSSVKEENILDICVTQKESFEGLLQQEKPIKNNINSHEPPEFEMNNSAEGPSDGEKLMDDSDEPINSNDIKHNVKRSPHHKRVQINSTIEYNDTNTFLNEEIIKSENIIDICFAQKEPSDGILEKEKPITNNFDSQITLGFKLNKQSAEYHSGEEQLLDDSDEPINSKVDKPNIKRNSYHRKIAIKRIKIEKNSPVYHRARRNTYDGTKFILKDENVTVLNPERKHSIEEKAQLAEEGKSDNGGGKSTKHSVEEYSSDEAKHLTEKDILNTKTKAKQLLEDIKESEKFQIEDSPKKKYEEYASLEAKRLFGDEQSNIKKKNSLDKLRWKLPEEINKIENSEETSEQPVSEEKEQFPIIKEIKYPPMKISSEEVNNQSAAKKRIIKPRISYAELDSDSDELPKSRRKIPSLKLNFPSISPVSRKLINRSRTKNTVSNKSLPKRPFKKIKQIPKEIMKTFEHTKKNASSSLNDSDDDKPLSSKINKPKNDNVACCAFNDVDADYRPTNSTPRINESDDDAPLKRIPKRLPSKKNLPSLLPTLKTKKNTSKLPVRKKYRSTYSPKRPSVRIQSKFSRPRATSLNYFALFLSDSDEDEPIKSKRRHTPDRLWTQSAVKRKTTKESVNKKISHQRKLICSSVTTIQRQYRSRVPKRKTPAVKMPILTREESDRTVEENIYECATMSTANETDEDACSDHRPKRRRQKVVKPMRIRCVSRRAIPTDLLTESSSCSSLATVQTARELGSNSTSIANFPKRGRLLRRNTLEKSLLMSKFFCESSSSSSPVIMNRRKRQFAAKSTSKPPVIKEHNIYIKPKQTSIRKFATNAKSSEPLTFMEKEAIHNHNCVNFQIRLQRLTANEAILCRKPYVRLDRNFVQNYFADKHLGYKEKNESEGLRDDNKY